MRSTKMVKLQNGERRKGKQNQTWWELRELSYWQKGQGLMHLEWDGLSWLVQVEWNLRNEETKKVDIASVDTESLTKR